MMFAKKSKNTVGATVILCAFQLCFAVNDGSCVKRISSCPLSVTWGNRSQEMNCFKDTYYVCMKNRDNDLVEGCFPKYQIRREGCPYVSECDSSTKFPVLAAKFRPCPPDVDDCPKGETYYISQIYTYKSCISPPNHQQGLTVGQASSSESVTTIQAISSTQNLTRKDLMSTNDNDDYVHVVVPIVIVLLLVIIVTVFLMLRFKRKRKVLKTENPEKDLQLGSMFNEGPRGLPDDQKPFLQNTENLDVAETTLNSTIKSVASVESGLSDLSESSVQIERRKGDLSESSVQIERRKDLIEDDTKRRISGYGEESEGHECCKRKPKLYCVTGCGNFEFCIKCGNSHSEKNPKHDVIACSNRQIRCRKHDTFPIRWFCCFCQDYICDSCITLNRDAGGHAGHALQNLCDRILDLSSSLKSLLGELTFTFEKLKIEMKGLDELKETMMESVSIDEDMRKKKIKDIKNDREKKLLELNSNRKRIRDITGGDIKILEIYIRKYIGQVNP